VFPFCTEIPLDGVTESEHAVKIQWTFSENSVNTQWTLSEHSVNTHWTFSEHSLNNQWTFSEHSVNIPVDGVTNLTERARNGWLSLVPSYNFAVLKQNETKSKETKRNETKSHQMKQTEIKWNKLKPSETTWNQTKQMHRRRRFYSRIKWMVAAAYFGYQGRFGFSSLA
jgi:hypothetical protein